MPEIKNDVSYEVHICAIQEIVRLRAILKKYDTFHKNMPKIKAIPKPRGFADHEEHIEAVAKVIGWNECVRSIDDSSLWVR